MLMLRLLCSHFADNALDFEDFNSRLNCGPLRIATALGCILEDAKELRGIEYPSVLLCIDELMKCGWHDDRDPTLLLSRVGVSMDSLGAARPMGRAVITVVTSLRKRGLIPMDSTDSSRPIHRVPLEGLSFDDCLRLVSSYVKRRGGPANLATLSWFQGMVALCSGHPRSLEYLAEELGNAYAEDGGDLPTLDRVQVLAHACAAMATTVRQKHAGPAGVDALALLRCIVAGKPVALDSKVGSTTVEALIAAGLFTNAGKPLNSDDNFVVPAMSMLLMNTFTGLPQHVRAAVRAFMVAACHPGLSLGGSAFESLHTAVEVLKRAVLVTADGEASPPLGLDEVFQHTMKPKKLPQWWHNTQVQFNVPRRCTTKGSEQLRFDLNNVVASRKKIQHKGGDVIVPAAPNNPGCDVVFVDQAAGKNSHIITFMEARYTRFKAEANRRAPPSSLQADLTTKFEVLTKHGVCVQACVCWCLRESNHSARSLGFERKTALERKVCEPVSAAPTIQR